MPHPAGFDRRNASCYHLYGAAACLEPGDPLLQKKVSGACSGQTFEGPFCFFGPAYPEGDSCCFMVSGGVCDGRPFFVDGVVRTAPAVRAPW